MSAREEEEEDEEGEEELASDLRMWPEFKNPIATGKGPDYRGIGIRACRVHAYRPFAR